MKDLPGGDALDRARVEAGLALSELWLRYFALGGTAPSLVLDGWCHGALVASPVEYNLVAQALNERFLELGLTPPLPYRDEGP